MIVAEKNRYAPRKRRAIRKTRDGSSLADRARLDLVDESARDRLGPRLEPREHACDPSFRRGRAIVRLAIMHRDCEALVLAFDAVDAVERAEARADPVEVHRGAGQHRSVLSQPDLRALLTADWKPKRTKRMI